MIVMKVAFESKSKQRALKLDKPEISISISFQFRPLLTCVLQNNVINPGIPDIEAAKIASHRG